MSALGVCNRRNQQGQLACQGDLCTCKDANNKTIVACSQCRHPQPDHPMVKTIAEAEAKALREASKQAVNIPPQDYAVTWLQRIQALEKELTKERSRVDQMQSRIAALEKASAERPAANRR